MVFKISLMCLILIKHLALIIFLDGSFRFVLLKLPQQYSSQSLNTGDIPLDWLGVNITPVYKKEINIIPQTIVRSLLYACCKMEHILYHTIMKHLETNNILSDFQYRFRPAHSCETQLISCTSRKKFNNHSTPITMHADLIMLDFSKPFNIVPHILDY